MTEDWKKTGQTVLDFMTSNFSLYELQTKSVIH